MKLVKGRYITNALCKIPPMRNGSTIATSIQSEPKFKVGDFVKLNPDKDSGEMAWVGQVVWVTPESKGIKVHFWNDKSKYGNDYGRPCTLKN